MHASGQPQLDTHKSIQQTHKPSGSPARAFVGRPPGAGGRQQSRTACRAILCAILRCLRRCALRRAQRAEEEARATSHGRGAWRACAGIPNGRGFTVQALTMAVTCAILASAGPQRSRVMGTFYKDERSALPRRCRAQRVCNRTRRILLQHDATCRSAEIPVAERCNHGRAAALMGHGLVLQGRTMGTPCRAGYYAGRVPRRAV
jgi:hypothetical protein